MVRTATTFLAALSLAAAAALAAMPAKAGAISALDILREFNVVALSDMEMTGRFSTVEGRALIGGDLEGRGRFFARGRRAPASAFDALTVGGDLSGRPVSVHGRGDVTVGGNVRGLRMRGGRLSRGAAEMSDFTDILTEFSALLRGRAGNSLVSLGRGRATFSSAPSAEGLSIFSIADGADFFSGLHRLTFDLQGDETVLVNVGGEDIDLAAGFLAAHGRDDVAGRLLWNFYEAEEVHIGRSFYGSVLAPLADFSNRGSIWGSVIADEVTQRGAFRLAAFNGAVSSPSAQTAARGAVSAPEPGPLTVVALGLLALGLMHRFGRRVASGRSAGGR